MKMDRRERKYQTWVPEGADSGMSFEISVDNVNWTPVSLVGGEIQVLFRGPDAPTYIGAIDVVEGRNPIVFRVVDNPEIEIDGVGTLVVS